MPPFQQEVGEQSTRPLPFLSRNVNPRPPRPVTRAFAAEPAEQCTGVSRAFPAERSSHRETRANRLFQDEHDETEPPKKMSRRQVSSLFGEEGEENTTRSSASSRTATTPFGSEMDEPDSVPGLSNLPSSDDEPASEEDFVPKTESVFSLGWHRLTAFKDATFWKEHMDDPKSVKRTRKYDNRNRQASAEYLRKQSQDVFKKNGLDPGRLKKLFNTTECQCALNSDWCHFFFVSVFY